MIPTCTDSLLVEIEFRPCCYVTVDLSYVNHTNDFIDYSELFS